MFLIPKCLMIIHVVSNRRNIINTWSMDRLKMRLICFLMMILEQDRNCREHKNINAILPPSWSNFTTYTIMFNHYWLCSQDIWHLLCFLISLGVFYACIFSQHSVKIPYVTLPVVLWHHGYFGRSHESYWVFLSLL